MVRIPQKKLIILDREEEGGLIFDETIHKKAWTDEKDVMSWYCDHYSYILAKSYSLDSAFLEIVLGEIPKCFIKAVLKLLAWL